MRTTLALPTDPIEAGLLAGIVIAALCGAGGFYSLRRIRLLDQIIAVREAGPDMIGTDVTARRAACEEKRGGVWRTR